MNPFLRGLVRRGYPVVTPLLRDIYRLKGIVKFGLIPFAKSLRWYVTSKEYTNYTYDISRKSRKYLAVFIANAFDKELEDIEGFLGEIENDRALAQFFTTRIPKTDDRYFADLPVKCGRRVGWYALVRMLKPRVVIESGTDRGIGACVLASAMLRNREEGHAGRIITIDCNAYAGAYIAEPYSSVIEIAYDDSLAYLKNMNHVVDIFIHDSRHSAEHEMKEFELIAEKMSPNGVIVTDNADVTDCLCEFSRQRSMKFWYWQEEVVNHVASAGSIGLAFRKGV